LSVRLRHRPGFTLIELVITVTIIAALVFVGATSLRTTDTQATRDRGFDIVELLRRARYHAARQNVAVVVRVVPFDATLSGGGKTRGLVEAYAGSDTACPQPVTAASERLAAVDFGLLTPGGAPAPGLAVIRPASVAGEGASDGFCIRPNGRILANATGQPIPSLSSDPAEMSGKAHLFVQWDPVREEDGALAVPFVEVEVPFNGLVRIPQ
jgi:prepilin-type N-terminal cleavage/methylation domain-containing protein